MSSSVLQNIFAYTTNAFVFVWRCCCVSVTRRLLALTSAASQHTPLQESYETESFDEHDQLLKLRTNSSVLQLSASSSNNNAVVHRSPECVICMEEFSTENPRMPTLCACGENRTMFHYPCLLLWLEKKSTCPSCSSSLFYEVSEFFLLITACKLVDLPSIPIVMWMLLILGM